MPPGLGDTTGSFLQKALRRAVYDLAVTESRPVFPARLHVGIPGGMSVVQAVRPTGTDHALRTDIVAAMVSRLAGVQVPMVWLTRPGELDPVEDLDQEWLAATWQAFTELGRPLVFVTVNRHGWHDPRSGVGRRWARLRDRSRA
ncbi:hypothetical protein [Nocardioides sp. Kera G14]|uniref:hypothetical protein n=1 Tax=Nocardioides sp. Kera G14 TaxID=2884264 RepID=UPI001D0FA854|nr:hypothetical protein [Nocardioides sp. Kera G14]UDY22406.1 hypothetical protein LH076_09970 [Nocardioides sp. Kera G14]